MDMCYKKCSLWNNGEYPKRDAPFACCKSTCTGFDCCKASAPIPGHGYFVDGEGTAPNIAGTCDSNEETWLGLCYKTCSSLTNDLYPRRVGPNSCCKKTGSCMNIFFNVKTKGFGCNGYGVGGNLQSAHSCPHPPVMPAAGSTGSSSGPTPSPSPSHVASCYIHSLLCATESGLTHATLDGVCKEEGNAVQNNPCSPAYTCTASSSQLAQMANDVGHGMNNLVEKFGEGTMETMGVKFYFRRTPLLGCTVSNVGEWATR